MYVADLSPPSDPEDTVQLVAACEQFLCELRPVKSEEDREGQLSSLRPPSSLSSHPDRDVSVVESKSGQREEDLFFRRRKKRSYTHHLDSTLAAPYEATFRSLR